MSETVTETLTLGFRLEHRDNNGDVLQVFEGPIGPDPELLQEIAPGGVLDYSVTQGRGVIVYSRARPGSPTRVTVDSGAEQVMCVLLRAVRDGEGRPARPQAIRRELTEENADSRKRTFKHFELDEETALVIVVPGEEALLEAPPAKQPPQADAPQADQTQAGAGADDPKAEGKAAKGGKKA